MYAFIVFIIFNSIFIEFGYAQGQVPPGVPPQRYQQAPPVHQQMPQQNVPMQQQYQPQMQQPHISQQAQHMPQQPQHMPQQPQHMPPQGQHVPQQPQHMPQHQNIHAQQAGHHGHHGGAPNQIFNPDVQHEKEHIAEHLEIPMDTSKMSEQELQFHYFKMHDADNNNKLDGCELIKSLIHWHEQGNKEPSTTESHEPKIFKDEELMSLIDPILNSDDLNNDGFIDYPEFMTAQQKALAKSKSGP